MPSLHASPTRRAAPRRRRGAAGRTKTVASSAGTTTLAYDYESRATSISGPGVSNAFSYNGLDARVGKVDSAGTATYRRDGAEVADDVLSDGAAVYTPGISQRRAGTTTFDLPDRLGTSIRQTSATANTQATRTYDAFGVLTASTGTPQGPFGFVGAEGYQEDGDSGLKLLGRRYYDPSTGRFLTRDPAEDGRNWYGYVENNPLGAVDPEGLQKLSDPVRVGPLLPPIDPLPGFPPTPVLPPPGSFPLPNPDPGPVQLPIPKGKRKPKFPITGKPPKIGQRGRIKWSGTTIIVRIRTKW